MPENESIETDLSPRQMRFLTSLLSGDSILVAAKSAKIAEATAHRWLNDETFNSAYKAAKNRLFDGTINRLLADLGEVHSILMGILRDTEEPASARVSAGKFLFDKCIEMNENASLKEQIVELEARL